MRKGLLLICLMAIAGGVDSQAQTVSTLVDLGQGFNFGDGLVVGPDGNLYIAEGYTGRKILKVTLADGQEPVVSEYANVFSPVCVFFDSQGMLYVNSYSGNKLFQIDEEGTAIDFATGLDGSAGIAINAADEIFVSEYGAALSGMGQSVKKLSPSGVVTPYVSGSGLRDPIGIALDESGNVYVSNFSGGQIYKIATDKTVTLLAQIPGNINQIAYANGRLYVPSPTANKIFTVDLDGTVTLIAGTGSAGTTNGAALEATFSRPNSIAASVTGDTLYVLDRAPGIVRMITNEVSTGLGDNGTELPSNVGFGQNYPNPFNSTTRISYTLPRPEFVSLSVTDLLGREVRSLVQGVQQAEQHIVEFNASGLPVGIYLYRLRAGDFVETRSMSVVR